MCSHVDGEHLVLGMLVLVAASAESGGDGGWDETRASLDRSCISIIWRVLSA